MSKESLDYQKLCSNYYSSWEEGCCMESCEFYNHNECPVVYVNGLIDDLEAKLAESENQNKRLYSEKESAEKILRMSTDEQTREILALKQQLAEKEKQIEELKLKLDIRAISLQNINNERMQANQDKISFAVEQLEKVKEKALHFYVNDTPKLTGYYIDVNEIDNQIEELKKEMK